MAEPTYSASTSIIMTVPYDFPEVLLLKEDIADATNELPEVLNTSLFPSAYVVETFPWMMDLPSLPSGRAYAPSIFIKTSELFGGFVTL
jgi:hypothetical protein